MRPPSTTCAFVNILIEDGTLSFVLFDLHLLVPMGVCTPPLKARKGLGGGFDPPRNQVCQNVSRTAFYGPIKSHPEYFPTNNVANRRAYIPVYMV